MSLKRPVYSMTVDGGPLLPFAANGVRLLGKVQHNQAAGGVSLHIMRKPSAAQLIATDQRVIIYRDNVRWFEGIAGATTKSYEGRMWGHSLTIHDAWKGMEDSNYRAVTSLPIHDAISSTAWTMLRSYQLADIPGDFIMNNWPASLPAIGYSQWPMVNGPLSESILALLRPFIFAGQYWDYSTSPPTLVITNMGDLTRTLAARPAGGQSGVSKVSLTLRDDLVPVGIELLATTGYNNYMGTGDFTHPLFYKGAPDAIYPAGLTPGGRGVATLYDPGASFLLIANGAAQRLFEMMSTPVLEGTFTVSDGICNTGLVPGMTVYLTGPHYDPDWAAHGMIVQTVDEDPSRGITTVTVGAFRGTSLRTMIELLGELLNLRKWGTLYTAFPFQAPNLPGSSLPTAMALGGLGTGASINITERFDDGVGMRGQLVLNAGASGITGLDLVSFNFVTAIPGAVTGTVTSVTVSAHPGPTQTPTAALGIHSTFDQTGFTLTATSPASAGAQYVVDYFVSITPP